MTHSETERSKNELHVYIYIYKTIEQGIEPGRSWEGYLKIAHKNYHIAQYICLLIQGDPSQSL